MNRGAGPVLVPPRGASRYVRTVRTSAKLKIGFLGLAAVETWLAGSTHHLAQRARVVTKPLLMPTLAAALATEEKACGSPLRTTTLLAQAGGFGGDVLLLEHGDPRTFAGGAGSFALGHAAYITGFRRNRRRDRGLYDGPQARAVLASWALSAPLVSWGAFREEKALAPAVAAYSGVLATTVAAATNTDLPPAARRLTAAGALLFLASDTILGFSKFVLKDPPPRLESVVMATYTGAQYLLAEGAARA